MFNTLSAWLISLHHFYRLNEKYRAVARHIEQGKPSKALIPVTLEFLAQLYNSPISYPLLKTPLSPL
jgi:hypothetical protein